MAPAVGDKADVKALLARVRGLINRAASPNEHEALRAAWKACQMIREHGLDVIDPDDLNQTYKQLAVSQEQVKALRAGAPLRDPDDEDDFTVHLGRGAGVNPFVNPFAGPSPPSRQPIVSPFANPVNPAPTASVPPSQQMTAPVRVPGGAKFSSKCKQCGRVINLGEEVLWQKGIGTWCGTRSCYNDWKAVQTFNPNSP